jgi:hypothetical protein
MSVEAISIELAAEACGVSVSAIRTLLDGGQLPNSVLPPQNEPDAWLISVHDLRAAGLHISDDWLSEYENGGWDRA